MVPNQMAQKPLGLFFTKDLGMTSIVSGDFLMAGIFFRQV